MPQYGQYITFCHTTNQSFIAVSTNICSIYVAKVFCMLLQCKGSGVRSDPCHPNDALFS